MKSCHLGRFHYQIFYFDWNQRSKTIDRTWENENIKKQLKMGT